MAISDLKQKAKEAFRRKRYEMAVEAYTEYLKFEADDEEAMDGFFQAATKAREGKGKSLFGGKLSMGVSGKDPKKRIASALRSLAKTPTNKSVLMALGDAAMEINAFQAGIVAYKRAADADPEDNLAWKRLGEALGRQGRIREALDALGEAVRIKPRDQEALKLRKNLAAEGALKQTGFETAKSSRELIKDKGVAQELEMEARMQLTPEHAASEIDKVREEIAANDDDSRLHVRLADLLLQKNDNDGAIEALEKAYSLDPENYELSVRLGDLKLAPLRSAARKAKADAQADNGLMDTYKAAMAKLTEAALVEYGRRVKEHPTDMNERFRLGQYLLEAGRVDEALAEFQQTVREPQRKVDSLKLQARCFQEKNILNLALKKLEEAVGEFPTMTSPKAKAVYYDYGDLLEKAEKKDEAKGIFEKIVEEDAGYRDSLDRLSRLSG